MNERVRRRLDEQFREAADGLRAKDALPIDAAPRAGFRKDAPLASPSSPLAGAGGSVPQDVAGFRRALTEARERTLSGSRDREERLQAAIKAAEDNRRRAEARAQELEASADQARREIAKLREENADLRRSEASSSERTASAQNRFASLEQALSERETQLAESRRELAAVSRAAIDAEKQHAAAVKAREAIETVLSERDRRLRELEQSCAKLEEDASKSANRQGSLAELERQTEMLERQLEERTKLTRELNQRLLSLESALVEQREENRLLAEGIAGREAALEGERDHAVRALDELKRRAESAEHDFRKASASLEAAEAEQKALRRTLVDKEAELAEARARTYIEAAPDLQRALEGERSKAESWRQLCRRMEESLKLKTEELERAKAAGTGQNDGSGLDHAAFVRDLQDRFAEKTRLLQESAERVDVLETRVRELEGLNERLSNRAAPASEDVSSAVEALEKKLEDAEQSLSRQTSLLSEREETLAAVRRELEAKDERLLSLAAETDKTVREMLARIDNGPSSAGWEKKIAALEEKLAHKDAELASAQQSLSEAREKLAALDGQSKLLAMNTETLDYMEKALRDAYRLMAVPQAAARVKKDEPPAPPKNVWRRFLDWWRQPLVKVGKKKESPAAPAAASPAPDANRSRVQRLPPRRF